MAARVAVVASGARTPIGKLGGALARVPAVVLGGVAIAEALRRAGIAGRDVDHVVMGQVLQAGQGQNPARQAASHGGVPFDVPATTLNKVCLSGINAVHLAELMIAAGEADVVVAGGMESMSLAPYLLHGARSGLRFGDATLLDTIAADGLSCAFDRVAMGEATDRDARDARITREEQDTVAALSHARAAAAKRDGRLAEEITPVTVPGKDGDSLVEEDEGIRASTTVEALAGLRPAFAAEGSVTAGNASQISDGAAALVVMSRAAAVRHGVTLASEIVAYGQVAGPGTSLLHQPSRAIDAALARAELTRDDLDVVEINEAFAAVTVASARDLARPIDSLNLNGGAIALGHPIGMSGARIVLTLVHELRRRGGGTGIAAICGGGGQGDAIVVRTPAP